MKKKAKKRKEIQSTSNLEFLRSGQKKDLRKSNDSNLEYTKIKTSRKRKSTSKNSRNSGVYSSKGKLKTRQSWKNLNTLFSTQKPKK
mmetsp:Transcript_30704/g.27157  ORF Transcript_30704/g.27157 Transcript_30704/m.27157 type:complete len:87 (+) Transcript_30704:161-421(+)